MDTWDILYNKALEVQNARKVSPFVEAGEVAAAVMTDSGSIYVGVCFDMASGLGMCAERAAMASMITHGEARICRVVAIMPDGRVGSPCGACREFMMQLHRDNGEAEILLDRDTKKYVTLSELVPDWWGDDAFVEERQSD